MDPHSFFVDPDQAFFLNADPDLAAILMRVPIRSFKNFVKNTKLPDKEFAQKLKPIELVQIYR